MNTKSVLSSIVPGLPSAFGSGVAWSFASSLAASPERKLRYLPSTSQPETLRSGSFSLCPRAWVPWLETPE